MKKAISVISLAIVLCIFVACGGTAKELVGDYASVFNGGEDLSLFEDGTFIEFGDVKGTWKASGKSLTLTYSDGEEDQYDIFNDSYLIPLDSIVVGAETIPDSGLFNNVFDAYGSRYEFFDDGTLSRTMLSNNKTISGTYIRDGFLVPLSYDTGTNLTIIIYKNGITEDAFVKIE